MRFGSCDGCTVGRHDEHVANYRPVPAGMMGGSVCPCKGECRDKTPEQINKALGLPANFHEIMAKAYKFR